MKKIVIEFIPHSMQRYDTVGDWFYEMGNEVLHIKVSAFEPHQEWSGYAVALHELAEVLLCDQSGVDEEDVDEFDIDWEPHDGFTEPGEDPKAPYYDEHETATIIEKVFIQALGTSWYEHSNAVEGISPSPKPEGNVIPSKEE